MNFCMFDIMYKCILLIVFVDFPQKMHIAHGGYWTNKLGKQPPPFTQITNTDVMKGVWIPRDEKNLVSFAPTRKYYQLLWDINRLMI